MQAKKEDFASWMEKTVHDSAGALTEAEAGRELVKQLGFTEIDIQDRAEIGEIAEALFSVASKLYEKDAKKDEEEPPPVDPRRTLADEVIDVIGGDSPDLDEIATRLEALPRYKGRKMRTPAKASLGKLVKSGRVTAHRDNTFSKGE